MECSSTSRRNERKTMLIGRKPVVVLLWSEKQGGQRIQQVILTSFTNATERYLNNLSLKSEEKSEQSTGLRLNSSPSSSQLRNAVMFCHRLYKWWTSQHESPQHSISTCPSDSFLRMSATVVEADSRSTNLDDHTQQNARQHIQQL